MGGDVLEVGHLLGALGGAPGRGEQVADPRVAAATLLEGVEAAGELGRIGGQVLEGGQDEGVAAGDGEGAGEQAAVFCILAPEEGAEVGGGAGEDGPLARVERADGQVEDVVGIGELGGGGTAGDEETTEAGGQVARQAGKGRGPIGVGADVAHVAGLALAAQVGFEVVEDEEDAVAIEEAHELVEAAPEPEVAGQVALLVPDTVTSLAEAGHSVVAHVVQPAIEGESAAGRRGAGAEDDIEIGVPDVDGLGGEGGLAEAADAPEEGDGAVGLLVEDALAEGAELVAAADEELDAAQLVGKAAADGEAIGGGGATRLEDDRLGAGGTAEEGGREPVVWAVAALDTLTARVGAEAAEREGGGHLIEEDVAIELLGEVEGEGLLDGVAHGDDLGDLGAEHGHRGAGVVGVEGVLKRVEGGLGRGGRGSLAHLAEGLPHLGELVLLAELAGVAGGKEDEVGRGGEAAAQETGDILPGDELVAALVVLEDEEVLVAVGEEVDDVVAAAAEGGALDGAGGDAVLEDVQVDLIAGREVAQEEGTQALAHMAHGEGGLAAALGEGEEDAQRPGRFERSGVCEGAVEAHVFRHCAAGEDLDGEANVGERAAAFVAGDLPGDAGELEDLWAALAGQLDEERAGRLAAEEMAGDL